jgi:hypothetical protein
MDQDGPGRDQEDRPRMDQEDKPRRDQEDGPRKGQENRPGMHQEEPLVGKIMAGAWHKLEGVMSRTREGP